MLNINSCVCHTGKNLREERFEVYFEKEVRMVQTYCGGMREREVESFEDLVCKFNLCMVDLGYI